MGLAMLLTGIRLSGLWRLWLIAGGVALLILSINRTCEARPDFCSFDWLWVRLEEPWIEPRSPQPDYSADPDLSPNPDFSPDPDYSPNPDFSPSPDFSPDPDYSPNPDYSPPPRTPAPTPPLSPSPLPPSPLPSSPRPSPSPNLEACRDGNCTCVNYRCLW